MTDLLPLQKLPPLPTGPTPSLWSLVCRSLFHLANTHWVPTRTADVRDDHTYHRGNRRAGGGGAPSAGGEITVALPEEVALSPTP